MRFLAAEWNHLLLANYAVDPAALAPYVPGGTSVDLFEGQTFVSLVAFLFNNTRVVGVPVPGHVDFEEVNLRFYVKPDRDPSTRAVAFIREIVPKGVIPAVANSLFNENYVCMPMSHNHHGNRFRYEWGPGGAHHFSADIGPDRFLPEPGSLGAFITEHYWGYAQGRGSTLAYRVEHAQWLCSPGTSYDVQVDFASVYGADFAFLNGQLPHSVQYARGSRVRVSFPQRG